VSSLIPIAAPALGVEEEEAVLRVLRSGRLVQGPETEAFEAEFAESAGVEHAIAVANGTFALAAGLWALGIGTGDEVLVPAFSFAATAGAVVAVGATPVFVDVGDDYLIDLDDAATKVTAQTAAIIPVHLYGLMADMDAVARFAAGHGLGIVEDAAQAHLATRGGLVAGGTGVGAFSLYATKNMTTGEGGIVTTRDPEVARRVRLVRNQGMVDRYHHEVWGMNLRMTELQAAIGRVQLRRLPAATQRRRENALFLDEHLPGTMRRPFVPAGAEHVYHQYTVGVPPAVRDEVVERLRAGGIGADVYYPRPIPSQPAYRRYAPADRSAGAERAAATVLSLPVHPGVDVEGLERIVGVADTVMEEVTGR